MKSLGLRSDLHGFLWNPSDEQLAKALRKILRHETFCRLCKHVQSPPHPFRDGLSLELGEPRRIVGRRTPLRGTTSHDDLSAALET